MARRRRPNFSNIPGEESLSDYDVTPPEYSWKHRLYRCTIITLIVIFILFALLFLSLFVIFPLVFMNSIELERSLIFQTFDKYPKNPEFMNFRKYGLEGARNFYITVNESADIALGVWHVLPQALVMDAIEDENFDYDRALARTDFPVILYFHGTGGHRITPINTYRVLRRTFHVIAFDYRGYGDSSQGELNEINVVEDAMEMYRWLRRQTRAEIFVWGHSLGTSLSSHTISRLHVYDMIPMGLFLEAPFSTMREQIETTPLLKIFSWMPWFAATILDPLEENGLVFKTTEYILGVDCPIMIMHAADDPVIPYTLSQKLYKIGMEMRLPKVQGNMTYHLFPSTRRYNHLDIYQAPELPEYIEDHVAACREANLGKG